MRPSSKMIAVNTRNQINNTLITVTIIIRAQQRQLIYSNAVERNITIITQQKTRKTI